MLIERGQHGRETRGRGEVVASERLQELASRTWNVSCHHYCGILLRSNSMGVVRKIISQRPCAAPPQPHRPHARATRHTPPSKRTHLLHWRAGGFEGEPLVWAFLTSCTSLARVSRIEDCCRLEDTYQVLKKTMVQNA